MSEYQAVYDDIKAHKKNYDMVLPTRYDLDKAALLRLQHACEMVLVRERSALALRTSRSVLVTTQLADSEILALARATVRPSG